MTVVNGEAMDPWGGNLREVWRTARLKRVVRLVNSKVISNDRPFVGLDNIESGAGRLVDEPGESVEALSNLFESGDVLFGKLRPYLAKVYLADRPGRCSSELLVLRGKELAPSFLKWVLLAGEAIDLINSSTYGARMPRADWGFISQIVVPVPTILAQQGIAGFLDRKTAVIDAIIEKKERLVELFQEKRQALIAQAVTAGVDRNAPMKESGSASLGRVPRHWTILNLRRVGRVDQGNAFAHDIQGQKSGDFPWFKVADMNRPGNEIEMNSAENFVDRGVAKDVKATIFPPGAVIFPRVGAALLTNKRRVLTRPSIIDDNTYAVVPDSRLRSRFLYLNLLLTDMAAICSPGLVPTVTFSAIRDLVIALPPLVEQDVIVQQLETRCRALDDMTIRTQASIDLLREYRQALISAAVTGKLDIPVEDAA